MSDKIQISRKNVKGEDGYKTFSIRLKKQTVSALDKIAYESNRSRNEIISIFLSYSVEHYTWREFINMIICRNFRQLRGQRNWSFKKLSQVSGINENILINIENGKDFGTQYLIKLCRVYDIKPCDIFLPIAASAKK